MSLSFGTVMFLSPAPRLELQLALIVPCGLCRQAIRPEVAFEGPFHLRVLVARRLLLCPKCLTPTLRASTEDGFQGLLRDLAHSLSPDEPRQRARGGAACATWESAEASHG